jgi:hypothetical protein
MVWWVGGVLFWSDIQITVLEQTYYHELLYIKVSKYMNYITMIGYTAVQAK